MGGIDGRVEDVALVRRPRSRVVGAVHPVLQIASRLQVADSQLIGLAAVMVDRIHDVALARADVVGAELGVVVVLGEGVDVEDDVAFSVGGTLHADECRVLRPFGRLRGVPPLTSLGGRRDVVLEHP